MTDGSRRFSSLARAVLATGLLAGAMSAGLALAGEAPASPAAPTAKHQLAAPARGLGSAGNPILLASTEASAVRLGPPSVRERIELGIGSFLGAFVGTAGVAYSPGCGVEAMADMPWVWTSDVYAGGGVEIGRDRSGSLHLESGRVLLHDPKSVLGYGMFTGEYWSSSAGLLVRF